MGRYSDPFFAVDVPLGKEALAPFQPKVAQESAGYVAKARGKQRCADCAMFESPNTCEFVFGEISPEGVCRELFEPK